MYQRVMSLQRFGSGSRWPVWSLHGFTSLSFSKNLPLLLFHLFSPSRKIPPRNHRRSKHQEGGKVGRIQRAGENRVIFEKSEQACTLSTPLSFCLEIHPILTDPGQILHFKHNRGTDQFEFHCRKLSNKFQNPDFPDTKSFT